MFRHILTATDGSDWALKGVTAAIDLAARLDSKLTILTVSEYFPEYYYSEAVITLAETEKNRAVQQARADEVLASLAELARGKGVTPGLLYVANSHPATEITEKAKELGCDLIVIGSRGRRGLTKLFLGSQAAEVLANTTIPVMIIK